MKNAIEKNLTLLGLSNGLGLQTAGVEGLELSTAGFGNQCSNQLSYTPKANDQREQNRLAGHR